jgi:hypothetical protein
MFDASFERLNLLELLAGLGINPSGGSLRCPHCERPGLVFAQHGAQCFCPNCGIDDDVFALAKAAWGFTTIKQTVEYFAEQGYAPQALFADLEMYVRNRWVYDEMAALFETARRALVTEELGSPRYLLSKIDIDYVEGHDRTGLGRVCGVLPSTVGATFPWALDYAKFAKNSPTLVFPLYARRNALSGFLAFNKNGDHDFFVVDELDGVHYLGLRGVPVTGTDSAILVTSPRESANVLATVALCAIGAVPIIAAVFTSKEAKPLALTGIGVTAVTVWSNDLAEAYAWAVAQPTSMIALEERGLPYRNPAAVGPYLRDIVSRALPPFRAVATRLVGMSQLEAALAYRQLNLSPAEANCLVAATPMTTRPFIDALIAGETATPKGVYNGQAVRAGPSGWEFTDTGTRISNFTLALQETWAGERGTMVRGVVTSSNQLLSFDTELAVVQSKTMAWLTEFLAKNGLPIPFVYIAKLRRAVFDIAMSFGHPQARMSGDAVRWDGNALILPGFTITSSGEYEQRAEADQGSTASASLFRPPLMLTDPTVFADADVLWTLLLYIAVNVTHHIHGHRAPGIVLTGAGREAWTRALVEGLGLAVKNTSFVNGTCTHEIESVFPPVVNIASEHSYLEWIADERHNAILSSSRLGLRVLRYLRWGYVDTKAGPSAAAVAAIPQVINLIRLIIINGHKIPAKAATGATPYFAVATVLASAYPQGHSEVIGRVATNLGVIYRYGKGVESDALRLTGSVFDLTHTGDLTVTEEPDATIVVHWPTYLKAMLRHGITGVSRDKALSIYRARRGAKLNVPPDYVKISAEEWKTAEQWAAVMV